MSEETLEKAHFTTVTWDDDEMMWQFIAAAGYRTKTFYIDHPRDDIHGAYAKAREYLAKKAWKLGAEQDLHDLEPTAPTPSASAPDADASASPGAEPSSPAEATTPEPENQTPPAPAPDDERNKRSEFDDETPAEPEAAADQEHGAG